MNSVANTDYGHLQEDLMGEALATYDPTATTPTRTRPPRRGAAHPDDNGDDPDRRVGQRLAAVNAGPGAAGLAARSASSARQSSRARVIERRAQHKEQSRAEQTAEAVLVQHPHPQALGVCELRARTVAGDDISGLARD